MLVDLIAEFGVVADGIQISRGRILSAMVADRGDGESSAVWGCPDNIRMAEVPQDIIGGDGQNVGVKVNIFKGFVPFNAVDFVARSLKSLADRTGPSKQFENFYDIYLPRLGGGRPLKIDLSIALML